MRRRAPIFVLGAGIVLALLGVFGLLLRQPPPVFVSYATASAAPSLIDPHSIIVPIPSVTPTAPAAVTVPQPIPAGPAPVARITIPKIGIWNAPIFDRGTTSGGVMLIAPGYAATHYQFSAPFGQGNSVVYGHDDIQGNIFGRLYYLNPGDVIQIASGGQNLTYRVSGHQVVAPTDISVLAATGDVRLTIITCWPFDVDTKRWIVTALPA